MAVKFSQFDGTISPSKTSQTQYIVGFEGQDNAKWTMKQLADEIGGGDNIYTADGTISSDRTVTLPSSGGLHFQLINTAASKLSVGYESGYSNITLNPARPITGSAHRIQAGSATMLSRYTAGNTLWFGNEGATNNSYGFNMGAAPNGTSTTVVTIKGQGTTSSTTALLVEDSNGNDIIKALDDRTVRLGYNANQIVTESSNGGTVKLNSISGDPLFSTGVVAGSTGKINVYGGYFRRFEYSASAGLVFTNQAGFHVAQDNSSMLTCVSSTKGFLPPRMTTTQRDAINSGTFTTGLTLYNTTDNKLQFYNGSAWTDAGGGGGNIYTTNGTLAAARTVSMNGNNLTFSSASGFPVIDAGKFDIYPNGNSSAVSTRAAFTTGNIEFNYNGHNTNSIGLNFAGHNTSVRAYGFSLYGGGAWSSNGGYSVIGPDFTYLSGNALNARLGVIGKSATSTSDYALRVQDSAAADMLSVRDDGAIAIGKGAVIQSTTLPQYSVVVGYGAKDRATAGNATHSVAIGRIARGNYYSVAIGSESKNNGNTSVAIGSSAQAAVNGVSLGYAAGGASAGNNAVSLGKGASAKANSSIAIGTNAKVDTGAAGSIVMSTNGQVIGPSSDYTYEVYMSSNTDPDLQVIGGAGAESTLSSSLKVTGQAYSELHTSVSNATVDWNNGNVQEITLASGTTNVFTPTNAKAGATYILKIIQGGTSGLVTWESSGTVVNWSGGTAPTLTATSSAVDIVTLICTAGGSTGGTFYANAVLNFS